MANDYTATQMVAAIKRRGFLPGGNNNANTSTFTTTDLLALITEEARTYVTALLKSASEEYLVADLDIALTQGTASVPLPSRAVAQGLRTIGLVDGNGIAQPLNRIEPERVSQFSGTGTPTGYELKGNKLILLPTPNTGGTLRVTYYQRLSKMVDTTACGEVTAINTGTNQVTVSAAPATFTNTVLYDLVKGTPGFECHAIDRTATVAGNVLTFTSLPSGLAVGDFVCLAGESPIPQVPVEVHPLLAQKVVCTILEAFGDSQKLADAKGMLDERRKDALTNLTPRVKASARPIINRNGPGWRR